jgi:hypothetical protein
MIYSIVKVAFFLCSIYLIVGCVWQANAVLPSSRPALKACVWWITVGATMQFLAGCMAWLSIGAMAASLVLSISLGSFFLFANRRVGAPDALQEARQ